MVNVQPVPAHGGLNVRDGYPVRPAAFPMGCQLGDELAKMVGKGVGAGHGGRRTVWNPLPDFRQTEEGVAVTAIRSAPHSTIT